MHQLLAENVWIIVLKYSEFYGGLLCQQSHEHNYITEGTMKPYVSVIVWLNQWTKVFQNEKNQALRLRFCLKDIENAASTAAGRATCGQYKQRAMGIIQQLLTLLADVVNQSGVEMRWFKTIDLLTQKYHNILMHCDYVTKLEECVAQVNNNLTSCKLASV